MEYLIALLAALVTTASAVVIAVNIEKGKSWALEIAQTVALLNPNSLAAPHMLVEPADTSATRIAADAGEKPAQDDSEPRLAA